MRSKLFKRGRGRSEAEVCDCFEALEPRLALYQNPMIQAPPPITSLSVQTNTVVRFDTNLGRFDVELFDHATPVTVANFLNYIRSGRLDDGLFQSLTPSLLYGGRATYTDATGLLNVAAFPASPNGLSMSNVAQTLTAVPTSSTTIGSQFAFNLVNNPHLNTASGGYTVFGKVIQGWSVIQTIAGLQVQDFNTRWGYPTPGPYYRVPVTNAYNPTTGPTEATLVRILDIEITKRQGITRFYEQSYVFPEGIKTATTIERLDLVNTDSTSANHYQILVRYESGARDTVIFTGVLQIGQRTYVKINDLGTLVRSNVNYSFEVRSTRAMGVSLNHRDTSLTIAETFLIEARIFESQLKAWNFGDVVKSATDQTKLVYENLGDQKINVNIWLFPESGGAPILQVRTLTAFRRGTLDLTALGGVPNARYAVQMTSTGPIVAAATHYRTAASALTEGGTTLGLSSGGRIEGFLGAAIVPTGGSAFLDVFYSAGSPAFIPVDFEFTLTNGTVILSTVNLSTATRKARVDLSAVPGLPVDEYFSVHYTSRNGATPVTVGYTARLAGDEISTPFQLFTTGTVVFADGYTDPTLNATQFSETISVFNPFATNVNFAYDLVYHFSDGSAIYAVGGVGLSLGARQRADHKAIDFPTVLAKINSNVVFRFYSVEVISVPFHPSLPIAAVIAQMTRIHNTWTQALTTGPGLDPTKAVVFMENAQFD